MTSANESPDPTAVRVALWRAMHALDEAPPHVIEDVIGLALAAPEESWRQRPDMHVEHTRLFRASILARARFVEDLVVEQSARGVDQYVVLGAGLDTFAQRRPDVAARMRVFEIDRPGPQAWKRRRLDELGHGVASSLHLVPVDFEAGDDWMQRLAAEGFDARRPAVVAATGVSMYLTREAIVSMLARVASTAKGSTLAMTFIVPVELAAAELRFGLEMAIKGARAGGTPFLSFFSPPEMLALASDASFRDVRYVSSDDLAERYFAGRADGLRPRTGEELLVART